MTYVFKTYLLTHLQNNTKSFYMSPDVFRNHLGKRNRLMRHIAFIHGQLREDDLTGQVSCWPDWEGIMRCDNTPHKLSWGGKWHGKPVKQSTGREEEMSEAGQMYNVSSFMFHHCLGLESLSQIGRAMDSYQGPGWVSISLSPRQVICAITTKKAWLTVLGTVSGPGLSRPISRPMSRVC